MLIEYPPSGFGVNWKLSVESPNGRRHMLPKSFNFANMSYKENIYLDI